MVRAALKKVKEDDGPKLEDELSLFNVLLAGRIKENPHWRLTNEDFSDLEFFMRYTYEDTDDPRIREKCDKIVGRAYEKIEPLWSFSLTLCRELTGGDTRFLQKTPGGWG